MILGTTAWAQTEVRFYLQAQGNGSAIGLTDFTSPYSAGGTLIGYGANLGIEFKSKNNRAYHFNLGYQSTELIWNFLDFPVGRNAPDATNEYGVYNIHESQNWAVIRLGTSYQKSKPIRFGWGISYARNLKTNEIVDPRRLLFMDYNIDNEVIHPRNFFIADVELEVFPLKNLSGFFRVNLGTTTSPKVYTPSKDFVMQGIFFGASAGGRFYF